MHTQKPSVAATAMPVRSVAQAVQPVHRITSEALLQARREVEIEHAGKIYRLRVTQLNKLILTA